MSKLEILFSVLKIIVEFLCSDNSRRKHTPFWTVGGKPEYPERTHAHMLQLSLRLIILEYRNIFLSCKLHTERPQPGFKTGTYIHGSKIHPVDFEKTYHCVPHCVLCDSIPGQIVTALFTLLTRFMWVLTSASTALYYPTNSVNNFYGKNFLAQPRFIAHMHSSYVNPSLLHIHSYTQSQFARNQDLLS